MNDRTQERPAFIWDQPALLRLLGHPSPTVQEWAAAHILELYPEAAGQALEALPEVSEAVAYHLLDSLRDLPLPEAGVEPLQQFLKGEAEPYYRALAAALLVRHGRTLSREDLDALPMERVLSYLSDTGPGFEFLVQRYRTVEEVEATLISALADGCAALDLFNLLEGYQRKRVRRVVKSLEKLWQVKLPAVHRAKTCRDAQGLLRDALEAAAGADTLSQSRFPVLTGQVRQSRTRLEGLLKATEEREAQGQSVPSGVTSLLLAGSLALRRDTACLQTLAATSQAIGLWRCLALRPWRGQQVDPDLAAFLEGQDPEPGLAILREVLSTGWGYFTHAFYLLEALKAPGRYEVLEEALEDRYGEVVTDEAAGAEKALCKDPAAMTALLARWRQQPPSPDRLHHLDEYPTEEVVEFLLEHFDEYMTRPFSRGIVEVMREVASPRFLGLLAQEWREGERLVEGAIWFLAELHGMEEDERLQHIPRGEDDANAPLAAGPDLEKLAEELREKSLPFPLRCTACERTYQYPLERVAIGKRPGEVTIAQIIQCKGCGSLETYEINEETQSVLALEMVRLELVMALQGDDELPDTPLRRQSLMMSVAGREFRTLSEAYHFLAKAVEQEPENPELRRRLGNVLRNGLRPDLALPHYQEAVRLNPRDIEAVSSLGDVLVKQERYWEAAPYVEALAPLCRDPEVDEDVARNAFASLVELAFVIEQETGRRIELFPPPTAQTITAQSAGEPPVVQLFDLDLAEPEEFEQAYQLFRHGTPPRERTRLESPVLEAGPWAPAPVEPYRGRKIGRNEPCPCGSGRKYKRCCGR